MGSLTAIQALSLYIRNDERNARDANNYRLSQPLTYNTDALQVVADCALHWFIAKQMGATKLVEEAEDNLLDALTAANRDVYAATDQLRKLG